MNEMRKYKATFELGLSANLEVLPQTQFLHFVFYLSFLGVVRGKTAYSKELISSVISMA